MNPNGAAVIELAQSYRDLGLSVTAAGRFICSLADNGEQPRGRGVEWLEKLLKSGPPCTREQYDFLKKASVEWPSLGLTDILRTLERSGQLDDWQREAVTDAQAAVAGGPLELNEPLREMLLNLKHAYTGRGSFYWAGRARQARRLQTIFKELEKGEGFKLLNADFDFLTGQFGPAWREMSKPTFNPGDLCYDRSGNPRMVISGPSLVWGSPSYELSDATGTHHELLKNLRRRISKARA